MLELIQSVQRLVFLVAGLALLKWAVKRTLERFRYRKFPQIKKDAAMFVSARYYKSCKKPGFTPLNCEIVKCPIFLINNK